MPFLSCTTQVETADRPPCYAEDVIQPTILVLAGQTIHAESAASESLYHLDRGIASLTTATSKVTLERVERTMRTSSDNEPSLRDRRRHAFTLEHSSAIYNTLPSNCPQFYAHASTKPALGHAGLKCACAPVLEPYRSMSLAKAIAMACQGSLRMRSPFLSYAREIAGGSGKITTAMLSRSRMKVRTPTD